MTNRKDLASITLLASWEIWNKRKARVFNRERGVRLDDKEEDGDVVLDAVEEEIELQPPNLAKEEAM
jgi:hypothetical protein